MEITPSDRHVSERFITLVALLVEGPQEPRCPGNPGARAIIEIIEIEARHERERLREALMAPSPMEPLPF